jgi:hypothetical protein
MIDKEAIKIGVMIFLSLISLLIINYIINLPLSYPFKEDPIEIEFKDEKN